MFKTYGGSDLFDAHIGTRKQGRSALHSSLRQQAAQAETRILFDQMSQVRLAQATFDSEFSNVETRTRFNHLQHSAQTVVLHHWNHRAQLSGERLSYSIKQSRTWLTLATG